MASTVITRTVSPITLDTASQFPLSLTLTHGPVGIASILGVSFQHHHVEVWDKVPNFFVTQKPNWGARVTLLPMHRYYRITAQTRWSSDSLHSGLTDPRGSIRFG